MKPCNPSGNCLARLPRMQGRIIGLYFDPDKLKYGAEGTPTWLLSTRVASLDTADWISRDEFRGQRERRVRMFSALPYRDLSKSIASNRREALVRARNNRPQLSNGNWNSNRGWPLLKNSTLRRLLQLMAI